MITLNEEKELVRIEHWQDILDRVDYRADVDPTSIQLDAIIGSYVFSEPVPCGLSSCHQPHNRGYLVSTKSKVVTNIGNVCGKNHFSVDFQTLRNKFNRDVRIKAQKEALKAFISRVPEYEERITDLRSGEHGADWVYKHTQLLKTPNSGTPEVIRKELQRMLKEGTNEIRLEREASIQEIETHEAIQGRRVERPYYIEERIGMLEGLPALREENNLRTILVEDIQAGIERISSMNMELATEHQLSIESKWAGELDAKLERAEKSVADGKRLLEKSNLSQLLKLLNAPQEIKLFKQLLSDLP